MTCGIDATIILILQIICDAKALCSLLKVTKLVSEQNAV